MVELYRIAYPEESIIIKAGIMHWWLLFFFLFSLNYIDKIYYLKLFWWLISSDACIMNWWLLSTEDSKWKWLWLLSTQESIVKDDCYRQIQLDISLLLKIALLKGLRRIQKYALIRNWWKHGNHFYLAILTWDSPYTCT